MLTHGKGEDMGCVLTHVKTDLNQKEKNKKIIIFLLFMLYIFFNIVVREALVYRGTKDASWPVRVLQTV